MPFPEKTTQTFKKGDILMLTAGQIEIAAAAGSPIAAGKILVGFAGSDATGTTDNVIDCLMFNGGFEFLLPVYHTTPGDADTAKADIGVWHEIINETTGGWMFDREQTTDNYVLATEIALTVGGESMPEGTQYGFYWCRVPAQDDAGASIRVLE